MIDPIYVLSGAGAGLLVGLTGIGRGALMTPSLVLLFGVHPTTAAATDLLFAAATKTVGTAVHGARQAVEWPIRCAAGGRQRAVRWGDTGGAGDAVLGRRRRDRGDGISDAISERMLEPGLRPLLAMVLLVTGVRLVI